MASSSQKCSSWAPAVTRDGKNISEDVEPKALNSISFTSTRRCRHLEECMFPRYLSLDAESIDDFCMEKVRPELQANPARLYIESLHLKPFMKDKETLMEERELKRKDVQVQSDAPKRPCLPLRRNSSPDGKSKSSQESNKQERGEGVTDRNVLSQQYFGGFDGKRTTFLSKNDETKAGGGVAGSYCELLPPTSFNPPHYWNSKPNAGVLQHSKKKQSNSPNLTAAEEFNQTLSSEKKLASLRNQLKLHNRLDIIDNFVINGQLDTPSKDDGDVKRLQGLIKPVAGYIPPFIVPREKLVATSSRSSNVLGPTSPEIKLDPSDKNKVDKTPESISESLRSNSSYITSPSSGRNASYTPKAIDAYRAAVEEGQAQCLAANMLLECFTSNRRNYLTTKRFSCAWCTSKADSSASATCCTGDSLIQCLDCNLVGCGSSLSGADRGKQHIMLHFLLSGHRYGVSCGQLGELYCMGCGDFVHQECFDQERERLFIEYNYPLLAWKAKPILRGVDASNFLMLPEHGYVWQGLQATYPIQVSSRLVAAARSAAKRISIFRGQVGERAVKWGAKSLNLSLYAREHLPNQPMIPTPVGIYNMGNTCFISAVLHCLLNCRQLEKLFLSDLVHPYQSCEALCTNRRCLACQFDKVFLEYFGSSNGIDAIAALEEYELAASSLPYSCFQHQKDQVHTKKRDQNSCGHPIILSAFLSETWKQVGMKQLAGQHQHDAQEYFSSFINALHTSDVAYLNKVKQLKDMACRTQIRQATFDEKKEEDPVGASKVKDVFTGSLRSVLVCQQCNNKRTQVESFINLSLPIPREENQGQFTIESCLEHFTKSDLLSDVLYCPSCKKTTSSTQQHVFVALPEVLCLHLKRFDSAANKKVTDVVSFPARGLDMGKYLVHWRQTTSPTTSIDDKTPMVPYDLFATINHSGTLDKGHYIANVLKGDHWYSINDEFVDNANEVLPNGDAYMLFYSRRI